MKKHIYLILAVMLMMSIPSTTHAFLPTNTGELNNQKCVANNETYNYTKCFAWGRVVYVERENVSAGVYRNVSFNSIFVKCIPIPPDIKLPIIDRYFPFQKFEMDEFRGILRVGYIAGICTNVTI